MRGSPGRRIGKIRIVMSEDTRRGGRWRQEGGMIKEYDVMEEEEEEDK